MIVRLNKEKIFLIIGFIFLIAVVAWYFQNSAMPPDEGVVPGRAKGYFPEEMKGPLVSREYEAPAVRKSPFLPTSTGAGEDIQIDLPLPAIRIKSPLLTMVSPLPPVFQNVNKLFRLSQAASKSAGLILPPVAALLSTDAIVEMIEGIAPIEEEMPPKIDPDYRGDDTVIMQSGEVRTGRIVKERYTDKEGKQWMTFTPKTWKQSMEIAWLDIRQATSYKTIREEFQEKLGNTASDNADAQYQLALWCFEKGMDEEAVKCLERAINAGKTELKYYLRLAEYYASQMNMEKELSVYQLALKEKVVNREVLYEKLGGVSERLGMPVEALAYYDDSTREHPHYVPAWLRMGDLHFSRGAYDAALNCYKRVQEINAGEPALPSRMGTLEFMKGNFPQAGQLLGKEPGFANMLGVIALLSDDHQAAVQNFTEAIKNSLKDRAAGLTNLAYLYLAADKHKDAELLLQETAKQDPASAMPLIGLGYLRWMTNNHDDALQQFNKAVKIDPANFFAYYSRGQFHFYKRKNDLAQKDFLFCLDNNPSFPGILYHLGVIAFEDKKFADAMNYYTLYTRQIPDISADDYVNLGIIYAADRQFEKSFAAVAQATALKPEYLPVLSLQAYLLFMANNNSKEAIELLAQLTKKYPDEDYIYEILNLINRAALLVKWTDKFDRPNNADIGKVWTEIEKFGVVISLTDKKCVFSGKQAVVNQAITSLEQIRSKDNFAELEIEFESVKDKSDKVTGFYIADQNKRSMLFIANVNNQLCYGSSKSADKPPSEWTPFKKNIQIATDNYKIALKRIKDTVSGKETEEFKCFYDKELVDTIPAKELSFFRAQGASIIIGIFGYAPLNRKWELAVKNVTLLEERAR